MPRGAAAEVALLEEEHVGRAQRSQVVGHRGADDTATECDFTAEQTEAWTAAYFGTPTRADLARVRLQALCSQYGWSLWGFIQAAASPIDYDFAGWGTERYEKAVATFRGPDLRRLLEEVAS